MKESEATMRLSKMQRNLLLALARSGDWRTCQTFPRSLLQSLVSKKHQLVEVRWVKLSPLHPSYDYAFCEACMCVRITRLGRRRLAAG